MRDDDLWQDSAVRRGGPSGELLRTERVPVPAVPAVPAEDDGSAWRPGDPVGLAAHLGDVAGHPARPWVRWARVVGIRKDVGRAGGDWLVLREYTDDTERWPSGKYVTAWWAVPWEPSWRRVAEWT